MKVGRGIGRDGASRGRLTRVGDTLAEVLGQSGLGEALGRLEVLEEWGDLVGPRIGRATKAVAVRRDTLIVEVASSAWLNELAMMGEQILDKLNHGRTGPRVERLHFRLSEAAELLPEGGPPRADSPLGH